MRTNIQITEIQTGDILNMETVTEARDNGSVWVRTAESDWLAPYPRDFRVNVTR